MFKLQLAVLPWYYVTENRYGTHQLLSCYGIIQKMLL